MCERARIDVILRIGPPVEGLSTLAEPSGRVRRKLPSKARGDSEYYKALSAKGKQARESANPNFKKHRAKLPKWHEESKGWTPRIDNVLQVMPLEDLDDIAGWAGWKTVSLIPDYESFALPIGTEWPAWKRISYWRFVGLGASKVDATRWASVTKREEWEDGK